MSGWPLITTLTLTPALGALVLALAGRRADALARPVALGTSLLALVQVLVLLAGFDSRNGGLQFVERHPWIPSLGVDYFVGVDGLSILLVLLSALLVPFSLIMTEPAIARPRLFCAFVLLVETGLLGTFTALNFFHWFLFWELGLVPAWFLILLWGGPGRRAAATQFFVYTLAGSVALLLAMQALFLATGTFDFIRLAELARTGELARGLAAKLPWTGLAPGGLGLLLFAGVFLGLAVKVPVMPFHTWLPAAYAEAPSSVTMLLTGALSKMGLYGFLRILLPIFPGEARAVLGLLLALAVVTIVASALAALVQKDLKRMLAYSSVNHLGYCLLGLFVALEPTSGSVAARNDPAAALNGAVLQMFNHGITAAALFAFIALLERRSGGVRGLDDFGGLRRPAPVFAGLMGIALFASLGLPGLSGFVGEFLIFKGAFAIAPFATAIASLGLLFTAMFLLTLIQKVFAGPLNPRWNEFPDLTRREIATVAPALLLILLLGVLPQLALRFVNATVVEFLARLGP